MKDHRFNELDMTFLSEMLKNSEWYYSSTFMFTYSAVNTGINLLEEKMFIYR